MASITFILSFLCVCATVLSQVPLDKPVYLPEDAERLFNEFIETNQKQYSDIEKEYRFKIFQKNLETINQQNKEQELAVFGITQFSDLTEQEFRANFLGLKSGSFHYNESFVELSAPEGIELPDNFDWREHNAVTPVKNQGLCGSCYAFSATGSLEGALAIKHKQLVSVSEQQIVDCDKVDGGCKGGYMSNALQYCMDGVESESSYPYMDKVQTCKYDSSKSVGRVTSVVMLSITDEEALRETLYKVGPISIGICCDDILYYHGGILTQCEKKPVNHGVLLVGYGTENGVPYWIIKNSWGTRNWGEKGYLRIKRGKDLCGLCNNHGAYPTVA